MPFDTLAGAKPDPALAPEQSLLRFLTCGSVDDGKSTLIGRLLFDSKALLVDQVTAISNARHARAPAGELDLALVTDGLEAEREQGITIDVAWRYFATPARGFIIADAPGHEQYTRNMVTAASNADVAVILIDAARAPGGVLKDQTRRHVAIAVLMGLRLIVAVNKMDLVGWDETLFGQISASVGKLVDGLKGDLVAIVPISAKSGAGVTRPTLEATWQSGQTLLSLLETTPARPEQRSHLRFAIQRVARATGPNGAPVRHYQGVVAGAPLRVGQTLYAVASGRSVTVTAIYVAERMLEASDPGRSVSITLAEDVDLSRGDVLADQPVITGKTLDADLCWLDEQPLRPGGMYLLRQGTRTSRARVRAIHWVRDVATLAEVRGANGLAMNDLALVTVEAEQPLLADAFGEEPSTGAFILINPQTNQTAAAGLIRGLAFAPRELGL